MARESAGDKPILQLLLLLALVGAGGGWNYKQNVEAEQREYRMSMLGDQIREFERVQRIAREKRDARDLWTNSQATLELIDDEMRKRAQEKDALKLFVRRVVTINR